jgi:hypothetical protein
MPFPPNREIKLPPEAEDKYGKWLGHLNDELTRHSSYDLRSEIVRDALFQIFLGRPHGGGRTTQPLNTELPLFVLSDNFDARNVTLYAEHFGEVDPELYYPRKPLLFFWQMFDASALAVNHWLGVRFRCMLARHIFKGVGKNVRFHRGVVVSFGYNLTVEDDVRILDRVRIDDRGGPLTISAGTLVSEDIIAK